MFMKTKAHTDCPGSCLHPRSLQSFHRVGAAITPTSQIRKLRRGEGLPEPRGCVAELSDCGAPTLSLSPTATPRFTPTFQFRVCVAFPPYPGSRTLLTEGRPGMAGTRRQRKSGAPGGVTFLQGEVTFAASNTCRSL